MTPIKILILAANPKGSDRLRLDEEVREIREVLLEESRHRDDFEVISEWAVRVDDLHKLLHNHAPQIVHFSGHGDGDEGLVLENALGREQQVSTQALADLFYLFPSIRCVCLNACYSEVQAKEICKHIDCVVGMKQEIGDKAAIQFSKGFYRALGARRSFLDAYKFGKNAIALQNIPDDLIPVFNPGHPDRVSGTLFPVETQSNSTSSSPSQPLIDSHTPMPSSDDAKEPIQAAQSQLSQVQSPTFGNISIGGNISDSNMFTFNQAGGDLYSDQSRTSVAPQNAELKVLLEQLQKLKRAVDAASDLEADDKAEAQTRIKLLEDEIQQPEPKKDLIDRVVTKLKKGLEGVETLAEPVLKVASLVAKVWSL